MTIIPRGHEKQLHLCIANEGLRLFLGELLAEWNFTVDTAPPQANDALLLMDDGYALKQEHSIAIRLTHSNFGGRDCLCLPLILEELWSRLEVCYHRPPRKYLRIPTDYPVSVHVRGEKAPAQIDSLSPVGARLSLHRELAFGEEFMIILPLRQQVLHLLARVIYVTPLIEIGGRYRTGVIFDRIDTKTRQALHEDVLFEFLSRIRPRLPGWAFEVGLTYLDLPPALLNRL